MSLGRLGAAALAYAARTWRVFPVGAAKRPLTTHGFRDASCDAECVRAWWLAHPTAGIAWALPPGVLVLDVDARHRGHDSLADLQRTHGQLPPTLSQLTGGGGLHLVFRIPHGVEVRQTASEIGAGLDTRVGNRGYIVLPPSQHMSGLRYEWRERVRPVMAPAWLLGLVAVPPAAPRPRDLDPGIRIPDRYSAAALEGEARAVAETPPGRRNHRLLAAWLRLTRDHDVAPHLPRDLVRETLTRAALVAGLGDHEIRRTLRDNIIAARRAA